MKESHIREHLQKGWIRCIVTFEIVGKPEKHVESSLKGFLENVKKDHRILIIQEEILPPAEIDDGMFSVIAEEEMLVKSLETLTWLAINFSPASIEILEPTELEIQSRDITNWLNDLLANLHEISTNIRGDRNAVEHLSIAMNQLIQNSILLSIRSGSRTPAEISKSIGVHIEQLGPFLSTMTERNIIVEQSGTYTIPPNKNAVLLTQPTMRIQQPKQSEKIGSATKQKSTKEAKTVAKKKR